MTSFGILHDITYTGTNEDGTYQELWIHVLLERNWSQHMINVVLTCSALALICCLSFLIPPHSA